MVLMYYDLTGEHVGSVCATFQQMNVLVAGGDTTNAVRTSDSSGSASASASLSCRHLAADDAHLKPKYSTRLTRQASADSKVVNLLRGMRGQQGLH